MKPEDIAELDRRNSMDNDLIIEKLTNMSSKMDKVDETTQENYRALRGSNGDAGIVASMQIVQEKVDCIKPNKADTDEKIESMRIELHGDGKDDSGIVGEQLQIRKVQKWTVGLGTAIIIAVAIQMVTSLVGG